MTALFTELKKGTEGKEGAEWLKSQRSGQSSSHGNQIKPRQQFIYLFENGHQ